MALIAGDVKLSSTLGDSLQPIRRKARGGLASALGELSANSVNNQAVNGRPRGEYIDDQTNAALASANRGIDSSLYQVLGETSYNDYNSQAEHARKMALAKEIGGLNQPSKLQEVLKSLELAGQVAPAFKSLYESARDRNARTSGGSSLPQNLSLYGDRTGYARYQGGY